MAKIIISGGQTGADMGGLMAAQALHLATSGWAPKGWVTERGPNPTLGTKYGLMEHETAHDYAPRTQANVEMGDATVIFGRRSRGSNLTESLCQRLKKPYKWMLYTPAQLEGDGKLMTAAFRIWMNRHEPLILNVAGNRESVNPGIQAAVMHFLVRNLM